MSETLYPDRVTQGEDGIYRWSYRMDMYRNHYMRNVLLKIFGIIGVCVYVIMMVMFSTSSYMSPRIALIGLASLAGSLLTVLLVYYLSAFFMHGSYLLRFEMNEEAVMLVRSRNTAALMRAATGAAALSGAAAGNGRVTARTVSMASANGLTFFREVRGMKAHPQYDAINLRTLSGANQIWIPAEDYEFVLQYIQKRLAAP